MGEVKSIQMCRGSSLKSHLSQNCLSYLIDLLSPASEITDKKREFLKESVEQKYQNGHLVLVIFLFLFIFIFLLRERGGR